MERPITGFDLDEAGHWRAQLSCGHRQHVRHHPPFSDRGWVLTEAGRGSRLATPLDCPNCDRSELPEEASAYRETKLFTPESVPKGLLAEHSTKAGVWGRIHVRAGTVEYFVAGENPRHETLTPGRPGVICPEVEHRVAPGASSEFFVEFLRVAE